MKFLKFLILLFSLMTLLYPPTVIASSYTFKPLPSPFSAQQLTNQFLCQLTLENFLAGKTNIITSTIPKTNSPTLIPTNPLPISIINHPTITNRSIPSASQEVIIINVSNIPSPQITSPIPQSPTAPEKKSHPFFSNDTTIIITITLSILSIIGGIIKWEHQLITYLRSIFRNKKSLVAPSINNITTTSIINPSPSTPINPSLSNSSNNINTPSNISSSTILPFHGTGSLPLPPQQDKQ